VYSIPHLSAYLTSYLISYRCWVHFQLTNISSVVFRCVFAWCGAVVFSVQCTALVSVPHFVRRYVPLYCQKKKVQSAVGFSVPHLSAYLTSYLIWHRTADESTFNWQTLVQLSFVAFLLGVVSNNRRLVSVYSVPHLSAYLTSYLICEIKKKEVRTYRSTALKRRYNWRLERI
jgi:hypothetical protein